MSQIFNSPKENLIRSLLKHKCDKIYPLQREEGQIFDLKMHSTGYVWCYSKLIFDFNITKIFLVRKFNLNKMKKLCQII